MELDRSHVFFQPEQTQAHEDHQLLLTREENSTRKPRRKLSYWFEDLVVLSVKYDLSIYLQQRIKAHGKDIVRKARPRPLLSRVLDSAAGYDSAIGYAPETYEVLLNIGADLNEHCETGTEWSHGTDTVWSHILMVQSRACGNSTFSEDIARIIRLMLERGANPKQIVGYHWRKCWRPQRPGNAYSTTFHVLLSLLKPWREPWRESFTSTLKLMVENCDDLEITDSDGVGIQDWADRIDPQVGARLRQEIASKISSQERPRDQGENSAG